MRSATRRIALLAVLVLAVVPGVAQAATWSAPATISGAGAVQFDLAVGADGTAAMAWASPAGVRVTMRRPHHGWSAPTRVSDGRHAVTGASVAVTPAGEVITAWTQNGQRAGTNGPVIAPLRVWAAIRSTTGSWGTPRTIGATGHFLEARPQVVAGAGGDTIVVWRGIQHAGSRVTDAIQSSLRPRGGRFGGTQTVVESGLHTSLSDPVASMSRGGRAHVAWTNGNGPVVREAARTAGPRGSWGRSRTIGTAPASLPAIATAPDDTTVFAWHAAAVDSEGEGLQYGALMAASRRPDGGQSGRQLVSSLATRAYALAVAPSGETLLTFSADPDRAPTQAGLNTAIRAPGAGTSFGPAQLVPGAVPGPYGSAPAYLGDGTAVVVFGEGSAVRTTERQAGGAFTAPGTITTSGMFPQLAASGSTAVAAWAVPAGDGVRLAASVRR